MKREVIMNQRISKLKDRLTVKEYPICIEKACLTLESFSQFDGEPAILKRAKATANYLDKRTIFIEDDELIVGNVASKPMGMEAGSQGPTWPQAEIEELRKQGLILSPEDEAILREMDKYWKGKGRTVEERQGQFYDDERLWPFIQSGILCPPWKTKGEGRGYGAAGVGWGLGIGNSLVLVDYAKILNMGVEKITADAREELRNLRYFSTDDINKADFLKAVIIINEAFVRMTRRYAELATHMAIRENNPCRKRELERIAETCSWIPAKPARDFYEALQSFWFTWMMIAQGTVAGGRFDQFMYPFFQKDKSQGKISNDEALELLECLRIKVMQYNFVGGGDMQRKKWAGLARWNNWIIGGITRDGEDATNDLSYLILEAAKDCQTPHHTITVRVHEKTPDSLLLKALEVVKTGIGMPAFVGDKSYIAYLLSHGVPLADARDYGLAGCLDVNLPGKSRINAIGMFIVPLVLEITLNNGIEPRTGKQLGLTTGELENFKSFDELMQAFKAQLKYFMGLTAEEHNIALRAQTELFPDAFHSMLMDDAINVGKDVLNRTLPFENGAMLNPVGMINAADSLAAIKELVFDEKKVSLKEIQSALKANWDGVGQADLRKMCLSAPKYGNGDKYVDSIASELYQFWADTAVTFKTVWGGNIKPGGISITAHAPGGSLTGATPDGRFAMETLADGSVSPAQGRDTHGPTAVIRSAIAINQAAFQSTLLNMKLHPTAMHSTEDLMKLAGLIRTYFAHNGKHIQFNVVDKEILLAAQNNPETHRDLIVRVAGYSAYFINLSKPIQDEIIDRTEHILI
jgi:pyruvate formate-lyase/glycerol dehydratase family glycyl radical enzyme